MTDDSVGGVIERAHVAASRGAWQEAFDLFTQADAGSLLATEDLQDPFYLHPENFLTTLTDWEADDCTLNHRDCESTLDRALLVA